MKRRQTCLIPGFHFIPSGLQLRIPAKPGRHSGGRMCRNPLQRFHQVVARMERSEIRGLFRFPALISFCPAAFSNASSRSPDEAQANLFDPRIPFHSIRATAVPSGVARMKRSGIRGTVSVPRTHSVRAAFSNAGVCRCQGTTTTSPPCSTMFCSRSSPFSTREYLKRKTFCSPFTRRRILILFTDA